MKNNLLFFFVFSFLFYRRYIYIYYQKNKTRLFTGFVLHWTEHKYLQNAPQKRYCHLEDFFLKTDKWLKPFNAFTSGEIMMIINFTSGGVLNVDNFDRLSGSLNHIKSKSWFIRSLRNPDEMIHTNQSSRFTYKSIF